MCGIVAVLSRSDHRPLPDVDVCIHQVAEAANRIRDWGTTDEEGAHGLEDSIRASEAAVAQLRGFAGLRALLDRDGPSSMGEAVTRFGEAVSRFEQLLDQRAPGLGTARVEELNALLIRAKDTHFTLARDRLGNVDKVRGLAAGSEREDHLRAAYDINVALNALDRLEVRGRDSAGLHVFVRGEFAAVTAELFDEIEERQRIENFTHLAVRRVNGDLFSFVYKVAAEVGELGENVRTLRAAIRGDPLLHRLLDQPGARAEILGHTRWASVGVISQANAHPLNQEQTRHAPGPYAVAALNGDVDNYQQLARDEDVSVAPDITTDAKVIPVLLSRISSGGTDSTDAFRQVVARFEGSVAIAAASADATDTLYLALRGSGQALYVGIADGAYIVASEPYGIVEETSEYLRLDGETPADTERPGSRGQVVVLDGSLAGTRGGLRRIAYDGTELPVGDDDIKRVEITTRDIDRGDHSHYLKKEIAEAPESIRKTLRGRLGEENGLTRVEMGEESLPARVLERLRGGQIKRIRVIGQGTAAVAGQGIAEMIREAMAGANVTVDAAPATEVSGFQLTDDMTDHLYVAISQSGTTTDTNRTVDLLRARGASVIGIVNRRHSDLTERVDGVIYTSDGRDVEMSVASTKAFYSQIAAGLLLGEALAQGCAVGDPQRRARVLDALSGLPDLMRTLLEREDTIAAAAAATAPPRRYWAIVGNGRNRIAAEEIRIKLSELCYKSIACDATEDKKHIDLSSEPLVLVCAAGLEGGTASDVAKEVEIYAAHKAIPVVIATDGAGEWTAAEQIIRVPECEQGLAFILTTMAGHLYGYHAAKAIDALARPLREARGAIEVGALGPDSGSGDLRDQLRPGLIAPFRSFAAGLRGGRYNGVLEADTASRLSLLFRYATRAVQLEYFPEDFGRVGTPGAAVEELTKALTEGIEELSRPIDAIKHQAKTVTVGISRGDDALLDTPLVQEVLATGMLRERLAYRELQALAALNVAVSRVAGHTRYEIEDITNGARIRVVNQGGVSKEIHSRTESNHELRGTKNTVAQDRRVMVAVGRSDKRPILLVPESERGLCTGLVLLHVDFRDDLDAHETRQVLNGYRNRYSQIRDALAETDIAFEDRDLTQVGILRLLTEPIDALADELVGITS